MNKILLLVLVCFLVAVSIFGLRLVLRAVFIHNVAETDVTIQLSQPAVSPNVNLGAASDRSIQAIPSRKILPGGTHTFQTFNNCGPASLSMAFSHFGVNQTQQLLGQQLRPYQNRQGDNDDKSVTLAELAERAEDEGFLVYHRPAGTIELLEQLIAADLPVITRTWLKPEEDIGHYRLVKGYDRASQTLTQDDSLQGRNLEYSYQEFLTVWQAFNYEFLVLVPADKQANIERILAEKLDIDQAWHLALNSADSQIEEDPQNVYAHFNKSVAHYHLKEYAASVAAYESVANRLPPRMLWYQIEPILAYYQLNRFDEVLGLSQTILDTNNQAFSELHYLQSQIYQSRGQSIEATAAQKAAEQYNTSQYWRINVAVE